jgi:UDP:flavonoid glycosyltransferase YjiC (YdhE family)
MRLALLVCELNAGIGHFMRLRRNAQSLKRRGWRVVAGINSWSFAHHLSEYCDEVFTVPSWPGHQGESWFRESGMTQEKPQSYASMLRFIGVGEPLILSNILPVWRNIIETKKPDLVIGDNAPGAMLAAAGLCTTVAVGTGHTVPAVADGYFLPLDGSGQPDVKFQDDLFANINNGLLRAKMPQVANLADIFASDCPKPASLIALDPVGPHRVEALLPPELDAEPSVCVRKPDAVYAYFGDGAPVFRPLLEWLGEVGRPVRIFSEALPATLQRRITGRLATISSKPFSFHELQERAVIIVHHGGMGITQLAALAGIPQIVAYSDAERWRNGEKVAKLGAGVAASVDQITRFILLNQIRVMWDESTCVNGAKAWQAAALQQMSAIPATEQIANLADLLVPALPAPM